MNNEYIKGRNSVANSQKMTIYYPSVDLANDNVYTKFGLNKSILSQVIENKLYSDGNEGLYLCRKFAKNDKLQCQQRSCQ